MYGSDKCNARIGRELWDISPAFEGKPPRYRGRVKCPFCSSRRIWFKEFHVFVRGEGQYRMDIHLKCDCCGMVITFGVHITEEEFNTLISKVGYKVDYNKVGHVLM